MPTTGTTMLKAVKATEPASSPVENVELPNPAVVIVDILRMSTVPP